MEPDVSPQSTVSGPQRQIQKLLAQQFPGLFGTGEGGGIVGQRQAALSDLLKGAPSDISAISKSMFDTFDRDVTPRINAGFAGIGGSLSSRRGIETSRALGDVQNQIGVIQAGMFESARNRQLAAIQEALAPFGVGTGFSTSGTVENIVQPSIGSQLLGLGGQVGSAALLGGLGGPAGLAAGAAFQLPFGGSISGTRGYSAGGGGGGK